MPKRTDSNQTEIVQMLRSMGASVAITSMVGNGYADITVGYRGRNYLIEIKDGSKPISRRKLTQDEQKFHDTWKGQIAIIESLDEAIAFLKDCLLDKSAD